MAGFVVVWSAMAGFGFGVVGHGWLGLGFGVVGHGWVCCGRPFDFFFSLNKLVNIVVKERQLGKYIYLWRLI